MEWILNQDRLYENPLMTQKGRQTIQRLSRQCQINIPSLTGDCFMQAPFYKASGASRQNLLEDLKNIISACSDIGIHLILIPLVDTGRLENESQEKGLIEDLLKISPLLSQSNVVISFESDYPPNQLAKFIKQFDARYFGITYDIGNSASWGYNPVEEISSYGDRIVNVHIKDRLLGGSTVPLTTGNADILGALGALGHCGYEGNYILQTARAVDEDHVGVLCQYRDMVINWLQDLER
jgi:hexulose-6-phosphate isomerase